MTETIQESPIAANPNKPAKQKKLWIGVVGGIVAVLVLAVGFQAYKKHSFKSALRPYALKNNILTEDTLNLESDGKITFDDYFDKAKKNIEAREQLIQDIRLMDPGSYKTELDMYVEILKLENEYIQSGVARNKAYLEKKRLEGVKEKYEEECNTYGWECSRYIAKNKRVIEGASTRWDEKIIEQRETLKKWLSKEKDYQNHISSFLPPRSIIPLLEKMITAQEAQQ